MMKIRVIVAALVVVIHIPVFAAAGDVVFIGNPSVPTSILSNNDVINIFLGNKTTWDDGSEVIFVIQKDSACHEFFTRKYISKTSLQFTNYWKKQVFTGKGFAPKPLDNDQEVIEFVSQTAGAIGYVSSGTGLDNVKILKVK